VGAIRDVEGDKKGGYQTIPVKYGLTISIGVAIFLTCIWYSILIILQYQYQFLNQIFYAFLLIDFILICAMYVYIFKSKKNIKRTKALNFHRFFVIERIILVNSIIIGTIDNERTYIGILILIISLIATIVFQHFLRTRYEFVD
jgi:4-hydroxybenzoate polyprenyltransferase/geranylgeranylglycerol-phosphate geranylgeranyltransferase